VNLNFLAEVEKVHFSVCCAREIVFPLVGLFKFIPLNLLTID